MGDGTLSWKTRITSRSGKTETGANHSYMLTDQWQLLHRTGSSSAGNKNEKERPGTSNWASDDSKTLLWCGHGRRTRAAGLCSEQCMSSRGNTVLYRLMEETRRILVTDNTWHFPYSQGCCTISLRVKWNCMLRTRVFYFHCIKTAFQPPLGEQCSLWEPWTVKLE